MEGQYWKHYLENDNGNNNNNNSYSYYQPAFLRLKYQEPGDSYLGHWISSVIWKNVPPAVEAEL